MKLLLNSMLLLNLIPVVIAWGFTGLIGLCVTVWFLAKATRDFVDLKTGISLLGVAAVFVVMYNPVTTLLVIFINLLIYYGIEKL